MRSPFCTPWAANAALIALTRCDLFIWPDLHRFIVPSFSIICCFVSRVINFRTIFVLNTDFLNCFCHTVFQGSILLFCGPDQESHQSHMQVPFGGAKNPLKSTDSKKTASYVMVHGHVQGVLCALKAQSTKTKSQENLLMCCNLAQISLCGKNLQIAQKHFKETKCHLKKQKLSDFLRKCWVLLGSRCQFVQFAGSRKFARWMERCNLYISAPKLSH